MFCPLKIFVLSSNQLFERNVYHPEIKFNITKYIQFSGRKETKYVSFYGNPELRLR